MEYEMTQERPSATAAFFRGFLTSAATGALMAGIFAALSMTSIFGAPAAGIAWGVIALTTTATGLFGGLIAAKRALFDATEVAHHAPTYVPVPVAGMSGPAMAPAVSYDAPPDQPSPVEAANGRWADKVGRDAPTTRVQQILANGSMSDKERASALLAARDEAANAPAAQARA